MRKIIRFINNYSKDIIQLGLSLVVIVIAFVVYHKGIDEINIDIFITFIYVCVCTFLANVIYYWMIIPELSEPPVRTLGATIPENESHIFR